MCPGTANSTRSPSTACGSDEYGSRAGIASVVSTPAGETLTCHDNHAVSSEFYDVSRVGYSCYNDAGMFYSVGVYPDGTLAEFKGPFNLDDIPVQR